jgi:molybdopterin molybdotransferase
MASGSTRAKATLTVPQRKPPLAVDRAVDIVRAEAQALGSETVPLNEGLARVLGEPARSADDVPPFDNSAMDGFAVRAADTAGASSETPIELRLVGESRAGVPADRPVGPGEAIRISTGAMLPDGADAVVRMEEAEVEGDAVAVRIAVDSGHDARRAGEDVRAGEEVVAAGTRLGPAELGVLASVGIDEAPVVRRPAVIVLSTGDELVAPGRALPPGGIRNTNAYTVPAQARVAGCRVSWTSTVPDDAAATEDAVRLGLAADLLVICGGVSVGPHDHVKQVLAKLGVVERFWGIALRPGRPTWFGVAERDGHRTLVFGLPGNPVSAMITFHLLARPAIEAMLGRTTAPRERIRATLAERYKKPPGRLHAVRCTLELRDDGWHARPTGPQGSHVLTSMLGAEALAMIEAERGDVEAGETVEVELLSYS